MERRRTTRSWARAIITAVEADAPPVHLIIGGDALDPVRVKLTKLSQERDVWEAVTAAPSSRQRRSCYVRA